MIYSPHPIWGRTGTEWPRDDEKIRAAFAGCPQRHRGGRPDRPAGCGGRARRGRADSRCYRDRGRTRDRGRRCGYRPDPHSGQGFRDPAFRQPRQARAADRDLRRTRTLRDGDRNRGPAPDRLRAGRAGRFRGPRRRRRPEPPRLQPARRAAHGRGRSRRRAGHGPAGPRRTGCGWPPRERHSRDGTWPGPRPPEIPAYCRRGSRPGGGRGRGGAGPAVPVQRVRGAFRHHASRPGRHRAAAAGRRPARRPGDQPVHHAGRELLPGRHVAQPAPGPAGYVAPAGTRPGRAGAGHHLRPVAEAAAHRGGHHPGLRVQPGRGTVRGQRPVAGGQPRGRAARGPGQAWRRPDPQLPRRTAGPAAPRSRRSWTAGTRCSRWP